jgi:hypothetical protein
VIAYDRPPQQGSKVGCREELKIFFISPTPSSIRSKDGRGNRSAPQTIALNQDGRPRDDGRRRHAWCSRSPTAFALWPASPSLQCNWLRRDLLIVACKHFPTSRPTDREGSAGKSALNVCSNAELILPTVFFRVSQLVSPDRGTRSVRRAAMFASAPTRWVCRNGHTTRLDQQGVSVKGKGSRHGKGHQYIEPDSVGTRR